MKKILKVVKSRYLRPSVSFSREERRKGIAPPPYISRRLDCGGGPPFTPSSPSLPFIP